MIRMWSQPIILPSALYVRAYCGVRAVLAHRVNEVLVMWSGY